MNGVANLPGEPPKDLTRNQTLVHDVLLAVDAPLSAYAILGALSRTAIRAPLQVYRALDKLVDRGLVHRVESLNAFVACRHPHGDLRAMMVFIICSGCGKVCERTDNRLTDRLHSLASGDGFTLEVATVELRGLCAACRPGR